MELAKKDKQRYLREMDDWRAALEEECAQLDESPPEVPHTRAAAARVVSRSESPVPLQQHPHASMASNASVISVEQTAPTLMHYVHNQAAPTPAINHETVNAQPSMEISLPSTEGLIMDNITLDFWDINDPDPTEETTTTAATTSDSVDDSLEPQPILEFSYQQVPAGSVERTSMADLVNKLDQDCQDFLITAFARN